MTATVLHRSPAAVGADAGSCSVVVPTIGRPSLHVLLKSLAASSGPVPAQLVVVDDRPAPDAPLVPAGHWPGWTADRAVVLRTGGRGPAAARNAGWRCAAGSWMAFLDDDVVVAADWLARLAADLQQATRTGGGGSTGRVTVPLPAGRRRTDAERATAGLENAAWITADLAYRRSALAAAGGFDERFGRAYREDSDLALRVQAAGAPIRGGERQVTHPPRPARWHASIGAQRGNADDALMRRLHGRGWRDAAQAPLGRLPGHVAVVGAALLAIAAAATGRRRTAQAATAGWGALTAELAAARIAPGPRTGREVATMLATSVAIPWAAAGHRLAGELRHRTAEPLPVTPPSRTRPAAVLLDRDGTLVHDVPYNTDPDLVRPVPGAADALARLRVAGVRVGVITNQSGVGAGRISVAQLDAVNARVEALLGPFECWQVCPHTADEGCGCRKPAPGLVTAAAAALGVAPADCAVVGDIGSDVAAGEAAGARAVLVPTAHTRAAEVLAAPAVASSLAAAVTLLLGAA